jgi:serine/threonine-protein kinase
LAQGQAVGAYEIVERIGYGGMATVYKAYQPSLERYVAIKMMHHAYLVDEVLRARFEREAQIVGSLNHPYILPIYDYAQHEGQPYLVMKHIDGVSLKVVLSQGALEMSDVFRILDAIASALDYAHGEHILHRDIKPSNILLDKQGAPYLSDFGLARFMLAGESSLSHDIFIGTPFYVSPEQGAGEPNLSPRADLYSLGVVMYELVVGQVPYNAGATFAVIHDHIYKPLPLPTLFNPNLPPGVEAVLVKALSKRPEDRYASAGAMIGALREAVAGSHLRSFQVKRQIPPGFPAGSVETPVVSLPPRSDTTLLPRDQTQHQLPKRWIALGAAAALILIGILALAFLRPNFGSSYTLYPVTQVELPAARETATANPSDAETQLSYLQAIFLSPDYNTSERYAAVERLIDDVLARMDDPVRFLMTAADIARQAGEPTAAFALYAQTLTEITPESQSYAPVRAIAGEYMYNVAITTGALNPLQIRRINSDPRLQQSPLTNALIARALITDERLRIAEIALNRALEQSSTLAETHLIIGELRQAANSPARARAEYELAANLPDAPAWVKTRAAELIRSLS